MRIPASIVSAALVGILSSAVQAAGAGPVLDFLNRVPAVPATGADAVKWFGQDGRLVQPDLVALKAEIEAP